MSKMGSHCSFGHLKHKLWPKEGPGVELPGVREFWLLTTKSRESTRNTWLQKTCDIPFERSWRDLQLCFRRQSIGGLLRKLRGFKVAGVQSCAISGLPRGSPGKNGHLDATFAVSCRIYYKGEGGGFPQVRAVVSLVCPCCPWLVLAPKVL
jgi:hypothetical protein